MDTKPIKVTVGNVGIELSAPLEDRSDVILIEADDGRRTIIGDGDSPFPGYAAWTAAERRAHSEWQDAAIRSGRCANGCGPLR